MRVVLAVPRHNIKPCRPSNIQKVLGISAYFTRHLPCRPTYRHSRAYLGRYALIRTIESNSVGCEQGKPCGVT